MAGQALEQEPMVEDTVTTRASLVRALRTVGVAIDVEHSLSPAVLPAVDPNAPIREAIDLFIVNVYRRLAQDARDLSIESVVDAMSAESDALDPEARDARG